ncbi:hypothetical protein [Salmonella phage NINP13076]|nr:hypothetical protein [Salmonella phage NINP13076]
MIRALYMNKMRSQLLTTDFCSSILTQLSHWLYDCKIYRSYLKIFYIDLMFYCFYKDYCFIYFI